jgi:hypothetical protein
MGIETRATGVRDRVLRAMVRRPDGLTRQALANEAEVPTTSLALLLQDPEVLGGLVVEEKAARAAARGGPRPNLVRLRDGVCVAGVEIGHGHIRVAVAGLDGQLWRDENGRDYVQAVRPVFKERRATLNWIAGGPDGEPGAFPKWLSATFATRREQARSACLESGSRLQGRSIPVTAD